MLWPWPPLATLGSSTFANGCGLPAPWVKGCQARRYPQPTWGVVKRGPLLRCLLVLFLKQICRVLQPKGETQVLQPRDARQRKIAE